MTTVHPLVSIISPTRNQGRYIEDTLRSVRGQEYEAFEHIVFDGGSTDGTLEILRRHEGTYPMRWVSEPDRGMYDAINKGLAMASGEIVAYLNTDDLYFPWTVATVVDAMNRSGADLVYGDAIRLDEPTGARMPWLQVPVRARALRASGSLIQPAVFWRRDLHERVGLFDASLRFVGDLDFWLRALDRCTTVQVDEVLAVDRAHAMQFSTRLAADLATEDSVIRRRSQRSNAVPAVLGRTRAAALRRARWLAFVTATRRGGDGWRQFVEATRPSISARDALLALLPGIGRRHLAAVRWGVDPIAVARNDHS
jgi:glycosyltransferase involved in cell wall biosynthesis